MHVCFAAIELPAPAKRQDIDHYNLDRQQTDLFGLSKGVREGSE